MFPGMGGSWEIKGVVVDRRELKSQKNTAWTGYVVKVATLGSTFEVQVSQELWATVTPGDQVVAQGHLEDQKGTLRLMCDRFLKQPSKAAS